MADGDERRARDREYYRRGLPDYHDPTAGLGGAPPARSALTLRLWLAGIGLVGFAVAAALAATAGRTALAAVLAVVVLVTVVDICWLVYRKHRGEPG